MDKKFIKFQAELDNIYKNNKIYRKKMLANKIKPNQIKSFHDIQKLPFTTKKDILILLVIPNLLLN